MTVRERVREDRRRMRERGLRPLHDSYVMIDKLTTVKRSNAQVRVGRLTAEQFVEVERAMMAFCG